jgi:hypothetical protein
VKKQTTEYRQQAKGILQQNVYPTIDKEEMITYLFLLKVFLLFFIHMSTEPFMRTGNYIHHRVNYQTINQ